MANESVDASHNEKLQPISAEWGVVYPIFTETDQIDEALALYERTGELYSMDETAPLWMRRRIFYLPDGARVQIDLDLKSGEDMNAENKPEDLSLPWQELTGEVMPGGDRARALESPRMVLYGSAWAPSRGTRLETLPFEAAITSSITEPRTFQPVFVDRYIEDNDGIPKAMDAATFVWKNDLPRGVLTLAIVAPTEADFRHTLAIQFLQS